MGGVKRAGLLLALVLVGESGVGAGALAPTDSFAGSTVLAGISPSDAGSNETATREPGEPTHAGNGGGASVWWRWTAPASGWVTISTLGSTSTAVPGTELDTVVGVYTGNVVSALTEVTSGDDNPVDYTSVATFEAVSGITYHIAVDGYDYGTPGSPAPDVGNILLQLTLVPITVAYSTAFDTAAGWTFDPSVNGSSWSVDATPSFFPQGVSRSGLSLNFNNGTDYAGCTLGGAISDAIALPATSMSTPGIVLVFWCNYNTETRGPQFDQRYLQIWNSSGTSMIQEWQMASVGYSFAAGSLAGGGPGPCSESYVDLERNVVVTSWHKHRVFLDPAWGTVRLRFRFHSVDDLRNNYAGWAIDDLAVQTHPAAAPTGWPDNYPDTQTTVQDGDPQELGNNGFRRATSGWTGDSVIQWSWGCNNQGSSGVHLIIGTHPQAVLDRSYMFYDSAHGHFHLSQYSDFGLWRDLGPSVGFRKVARGAKRSYCLTDVDQVLAQPSVSPFCSGSYQVISYGWQDVYGMPTEGQEIDVLNLTPNVNYHLVGVIDPLNRLRETSNANQWDSVEFTLPASNQTISSVTRNTNPYPQTMASLTIASVMLTTYQGDSVVHVTGTGYDTTLTPVLYGTGTSVAEAPYYTITGGSAANGGDQVYVVIPAGFGTPVGIDLIRADGSAVAARIGLPAPGICGLVVDPAAGLAASGPAGGPYGPSQDYTLTNVGATPINWSVLKNEAWVTVSPSGGTGLGAGQSVTVNVSANTSVPLAPGNYAEVLAFRNDTNGAGSTIRPVSLTVTGTPAQLDVSPTLGFWANRVTTGPVTPAAVSYTLYNSGGSTIGWSATPSPSWVTVNPPSGALFPGQSDFVTVAIDAATAPTSAGVHPGTVTFTSSAGPGDTTTRSVSLRVTAVAPPALTITTPATSPVTTSSSPFVASGSGGTATSVAWTNLTTGQAGNATGTGTWTASIPVVPGSNLVLITAIDASGGTTTMSFVVDYVLPVGGGGGGGGGCGLSGWEALAAVALAAAVRRRRARP
jgi:hypothetical protein